MTSVPKILLNHTGQNGTLYLSDLDGEANRTSSSKIQVYVNPGESVELPMNDRVLQSFNQGTIRGFMKEDLLDAVIVDTGESFDPAYEEVEYSAENKPSRITVWRDASKNQKVTETEFVYDTERIVEETEKQFDDDGDVVRTIKTTYTRDDRGRITSIDSQEI